MPEQTASCLPKKDWYFRQLKNTPVIAIPTFILFLTAIGVIITASIAAISGGIEYWAATLISGVAMYFLFSPAHESLHRSFSSIPRVNDNLGRISLLLLVPLAPYEVGRWIHLQHHRFACSEIDPDNFMHHGSLLAKVFRWANFDAFYMAYFLRHGGDKRQRHAKAMIISVVLFVTLVTSLLVLGYGKELLFLWFLPSRIGLCLIGAVFVFLPHHPADTPAQENQYRATTIRRGWEWLLTPLLVYQNYHLIHHLYPTAPFYNYMKIWHLKYDELIANKPSVQTAFGLMPLDRQAAAEASS